MLDELPGPVAPRDAEQVGVGVVLRAPVRLPLAKPPQHLTLAGRAARGPRVEYGVAGDVRAVHREVAPRRLVRAVLDTLARTSRDRRQTGVDEPLRPHRSSGQGQERGRRFAGSGFEGPKTKAVKGVKTRLRVSGRVGRSEVDGRGDSSEGTGERSRLRGREDDSVGAFYPLLS